MLLKMGELDERNSTTDIASSSFYNNSEGYNYNIPVLHNPQSKDLIHNPGQAGVQKHEAVVL